MKVDPFKELHRAKADEISAGALLGSARNRWIAAEKELSAGKLKVVIEASSSAEWYKASVRDHNAPLWVTTAPDQPLEAKEVYFLNKPIWGVRQEGQTTRHHISGLMLLIVTSDGRTLAVDPAQVDWAASRAVKLQPAVA